MENSDAFEWILFDADHTLFDFDKSARASMHDCLSRYGRELTDAIYSSYETINRACWRAYELGEIDRHMLVRRRFEQFFAAIDLTGVDPLAFNSEFLTELPKHPYLYDGALDLLQKASEKYTLGIITNGLKEVQRPRIKELALEHMFQIIIVSGEIGQVKPDQAYFAYAHREMGFPDKSKVLVVGDALHADIAGGLNYGFHTCWYNPHQVSNESEVVPHHQVKSYQQLYSILGI